MFDCNQVSCRDVTTFTLILWIIYTFPAHNKILKQGDIKMLKIVSAASLIFISFVVWSHAEHDKPRYVSTTGVDEGRCDKVETPCKTIGFAAAQSNKGDIVYVAAGNYYLTDVADIFYLTGSLITVKGGYSPTDKYKSQSVTKNPTYIHGIPAEYHQALSDKGFNPIADIKAMSEEKRVALDAKISAVKALSLSQKDMACVDNMAGDFQCNNMDLVAHVPLTAMSSRPGAGNDVWGHVDLNTDTEYALIGVRNGVAVFDLSDPSNPIEVGTVSGVFASWRDIKVYQYYDKANVRWAAYAYVSTDGADGGVAIIDLNDLPESVSLVKTDRSNARAHNVYISNVDYTTGVPINDYVSRLHVMGSPSYGGAHRSYSLANPENISSAYVPLDKSRSDYTHDGTSMVVTDERAQEQCNQASNLCDVFVDFNENEMRLWDQTVPSNTTELGSATYQGAQYVHSGWWSEDKKYIFLHDEQDELYNGINTTLYVFDVQDLTQPTYSGSWVGNTRAIDHNGYVRGNRYYMSNYEKGITILDITNPTTPVEVGNFDTFPVSNNNSFNGAWGVYPFLPSGLILASDINSGLYILTDNTRDVAAGKIQLTESSYAAEEGNAVTFVVERVDGATGAVSVDYETLQLSADGDDFTASTGTLTWADGDTSNKEIDVLVALDTDDDEFKERFKLKLYNVTGGVTLGQNKSAYGVIAGKGNYGQVRFNEEEVTAFEGVTDAQGNNQLSFSLTRSVSDTGAISVTVGVAPTTSANATNELTFINDTVSWADGELGSKTITVAVNNDDEAESLEQVILSITSATPSDASFVSEVLINLYDDDSNIAPSFTASGASETLYSNYSLSSRISNVTDDASFPLTYLWEVTAGPDGATITDADSATPIFNATAVGTYTVQVTVSDIFNASTSAEFDLVLEAPPVIVIKSDDTSSSGSSMSYLLLSLSLLLLVLRRTRKELIKH